VTVVRLWRGKLTYYLRVCVCAHQRNEWECGGKGLQDDISSHRSSNFPITVNNDNVAFDDAELQ